MTELEMISSMNDSELSRNARKGGIDSILEIGYRQRCHDGVMADADLDIGV